MINQEIIYSHLQKGDYAKIIDILHKEGKNIPNDPVNIHAINLFLSELFKKIETEAVKNELKVDLQTLYIIHAQDYFKLDKDSLVKLLAILYNQEDVEHLYIGAKEYPDEPICKKIIEKYQQLNIKNQFESNSVQTYVPNYYRGKGKMFESEIKIQSHIDPYLKVYIKEADNHQIVADHINKLPSVRRANVTPQQNGKYNLTIYAQKPYTIDETKDEVDLTLENYYSSSPVDPIFNEEVISSISDIAYYQVLDFIMRLGKGLEGSQRLVEKWDEERYRDYFIPYLDSISKKHTATGETWHRKGKTDILFRDNDGNNLLIAECKLWNGESYLKIAIDQLFERYVNWRDEKTAIIIFNTQMKNFTELMRKAVATVKSHEFYYLSTERRSETSYSFIYRNPNDHNKTIQLELIMFNFV